MEDAKTIVMPLRSQWLSLYQKKQRHCI